MNYSSRNNSQTAYCKVCRDAGLSAKEYTSHYVRETRDPNSCVTCPLLRKIKCRVCQGIGHYPQYCTLASKTPLRTNNRLVGISNKQPHFNSNSNSNAVSMSFKQPFAYKTSVWPSISASKAVDAEDSNNDNNKTFVDATTSAVVTPIPATDINNSIDEYTVLRHNRLCVAKYKKINKLTNAPSMPVGLRKCITEDLSWAEDSDDEINNEETEENYRAKKYYAEWGMVEEDYNDVCNDECIHY